MTNRMLTRNPSQRSRRRPSYGAYACAALAAVLLLLSVSLLHSRLSLSLSHHRRHNHNDAVSLADPLIYDDSPDDETVAVDDRIDELDDDVVLDDSPRDDELLDDDDDDDEEQQSPDKNRPRFSGFFYDHANGAIRRRFSRRSIDDWDDDYVGFSLGLGVEDRSKAAFGSDDVPVDETVRRKASEVAGIEDALMLKVGERVSPLREGWGDWFDKKSDFLRRDRMFKSNLESLNPLNNPMLQDPDGIGVTSLTRGDKLVQKSLLSEFKRVSFLMKKPLGVEIKRAERRTLDSNPVRRKSEFESHVYADGKRWGYYPGLRPYLSFSDFMDEFFRKGKCDVRVFMVWNSPPWMFTVRYQRGLESLLHYHPDACVVLFSETIELDFFRDSFVKDGYKVAVAMPNLDELLKDTPTHVFTSAWFVWRKTKYYATHYSELVRLAALYKMWNCYIIFMVHLILNSEFEILAAERFCCQVYLGKTKKLKITSNDVSKKLFVEKLVGPIFHRKLFQGRYGGIYLDSDIVVLKSLSSLSNSVGMEDQDHGRPLNGAVMAFRRHSPFISECMKEFYMTYDDTRLRWNGAELLTRVATKFLRTERNTVRDLELKLLHSSIFFPISSQNITRYFTAPATEDEKTQQDALLKKILDESLTFHFWNSVTSALIPEPDSLVTRLIDHSYFLSLHGIRQVHRHVVRGMQLRCKKHAATPGRRYKGPFVTQAH
ncbi:hypothetical protein TIFTF001_031255 [Ficus carica]|uniref:Alpha 1,4-glycosyltransferase domain-containing protein n=1 Tax=Ficus carica TaxID=3494 RepID=A0AA88DWK5_FICCA|nr:hypothetical protein TIFTF001_031255 [Ficus carica]